MASPGVTSAVRGLFITGTNTGVGKTEVAAALARLPAEMNNAADLAQWPGRPVVCVPRSAPGGAPWTALLPHLATLARQFRRRA